MLTALDADLAQLLIVSPDSFSIAMNTAPFSLRASSKAFKTLSRKSIKAFHVSSNSSWLGNVSLQTVFYQAAVALTKLLTPIIPHTTEEIWTYLKEEEEYVLFGRMRNNWRQ
jgi:leucyl-tRNA synthetase